MKRLEKMLPVLCAFFAGIVVGFLIAPIKKGIEIGNNAGNSTTNCYGDKKEDCRE